MRPSDRSTSCSSTRRGSSRSRTSSRRERPLARSSCSATRSAPAGVAGLAPRGAERSVLQHLLGEDVTVPRDRGLFLAETWRLRPSSAVHVRRVRRRPARARSGTARPPVALGNGPVWRPVAHVGRGQSSAEEADAIAAAVGDPSLAVHGRGRYDASAHGGRRTRGRAVQRPGADAAIAPAARGPGGDGRQVPGPAGAGRARLDGELDPGRRAARRRLRVRPAPLQRRHVARPVPGRALLLPAAPRRGLQDRRADAPRQRGLPLRRAGFPPRLRRSLAVSKQLRQHLLFRGNLRGIGDISRACAGSPRRGTSRPCGRAARCRRSSRRTTTGSTCSSSGVRARGRRRSSRSSSSASSHARSTSVCPSSCSSSSIR